jgi:hypothetical protein
VKALINAACIKRRPFGLVDSAAEARMFRFKEDNGRSLTANIVSDGKGMGNALLMEARQN